MDIRLLFQCLNGGVPTSSPNSLISPWRGRKTTNMPPSEPVSASGEEIGHPRRAVATVPREQAHPNCSAKVLTAGNTSHASLPFLCVPQYLVDAACSYNCPAVAGLLTPRWGAPWGQGSYTIHLCFHPLCPDKTLAWSRDQGAFTGWSKRRKQLAIHLNSQKLQLTDDFDWMFSFSWIQHSVEPKECRGEAW